MLKEIKPTKHGNEVNVVISDFVPFVDPADYNIADFKGVDPNYFFITSGDAVVKAGVLEERLWRAAGEARRRFGSGATKRQIQFVHDLWSAAGKARKFVNHLKSIRGEHIFLECEHKASGLVVIPKDPRLKE